MVPVFAFVLDAVLIAAARQSGKGLDIVQHGVVSAVALGWLLKVEGKAFLENIARKEGADVIPPGLAKTLDGLPAQIAHRSSDDNA
jgi:hypothetical protein